MQIRAHLSATFLSALAATTLAGCAPEAHRLASTISHPGPAGVQRQEAIQHDPYLLDDVGPEVVGARPREYQRPLNEIDRARLNATPPPGVQPLRPPTVANGPAPLAGPIYSTTPVPTASPAYPSPGTPIATAPPPAAAPPATAPSAQPAPFNYQQRAPY